MGALRPACAFKALASVLAVLLVGAFAKFPEAILPIGSDTGMFATYAREILQGNPPYVAFYDVHPPLADYYWVAVSAVSGTDWSRSCLGQPCIDLLAHTLDLALTFVAAGLAYAIARRLGFRPLVGVLAALMIAWFANESMISMEGSTPTKLTLVPSTLAVYALVRALPSGHFGWAVLAGAAAVLGVLAKQPALMTLFALLAYVVFAVRCRRRRLLLGIAAGAVGVLVPLLVYLGVIGSLAAFLDQAWLYNLERFAIGYWQTPAGLTTPATRIDRVIGEAGGLLFLSALLGALSLLFGPSTLEQRLLLVWGIFSLGAIAGFREFAQVVPSLALLGAVGLGRLWDAASKNGLGLGRPLAGQLALLAVFGMVFGLTSSFQLTELRRAIYERISNKNPADPELIATYLRNAAPTGPIFVWGNAGQIYALSGRQPASRFVIAEFTNTTSPRPALSREQLMDDLSAQPPSVIVVEPHADEPGLTLNDFPALSTLLHSCYAAVPNLPANWGVYTRTCT
jgi:dolichyl-phosphate-mannose-protein mannosyltransferase